MNAETESETDTVIESKSGYFPRWKVVIWNDDKSTMGFVVHILQNYFNKSHQDAMKLMIDVHEKGAGVAGIYPKEQAEFRVDQVHSVARAQGFPLKLTIEPEE